MNFGQFLFFFLYVRNWNTGQRELSSERLAVFCLGIFLVLLGLLMATIMQAPVVYVSETIQTGS